jgi:7-cyano-7-deazaguanine synthase
MNVLVLFSGGIDSTACVHYFLKRKYDISLLYFNYGQPNERDEKEAALNIAHYYNKHLDIVVIKGCSIPSGMIPGRNAFLLSLALLKITFDKGGIAIGVHDYTDYSDCSEKFIADMQNIYDIYNDGRIQILTPFLNWKKEEIIAYAQQEKLPLELVYSTSLDKKLFLEKSYLYQDEGKA